MARSSSVKTQSSRSFFLSADSTCSPTFILMGNKSEVKPSSELATAKRKSFVLENGSHTAEMLNQAKKEGMATSPTTTTRVTTFIFRRERSRRKIIHAPFTVIHLPVVSAR